MNKQQTIKRLNYLQSMIAKYAHTFRTSDRTAGWVHEYNQIRTTIWGWESTPEQNEVWIEYCESVGWSTGHTGYDCLG